MSPLGSPDFGANQATNPTSPEYDGGESATRLLMGGGAQARSGRWVFATGFEDGNLSSIVVTNPAAVMLDSSVSFQGSTSLKLITAPVVNSVANFSKVFMPPGSRFGIELQYMQPDGAIGAHEFQIQIFYEGSPTRPQSLGILKIIDTGATVKIYCYTSAGYTLVLDVTPYFPGASGNWHYIKFVFDLSNSKYVRLFFDDVSLDLTSLTGIVPAVGGYPRLSFAVQLSTSAAASAIYNIDNLIITADEP